MKSVFVSSTFRDMQAERDALALKVVPNLNVYAGELGESIRFVDLRWGVNTTDLESDEGSNKVLSVCLDEIDNTRPYMIILIGERYGWIPPKDMIKNAAERKKYPLLDFEKSVTELEIEYGALAKEGQLDRCLFYFREPLLKEDIPLEYRDRYIEVDSEISKKLEKLKEKIKDSGASIKSYSCGWDSDKNELLIPKTFEEMVFSDVKTLFVKDFEKLKDLNWQEREEIAANLFTEQKAAQYSAKVDYADHYTKVIADVRAPLVMFTGEPGSGKSTLMSKIYQGVRDRGESLFIACGNSSNSQTSFDLLRQMVYKIETLLGEEEHFEDIQKEHKPEDFVERFSNLAFTYGEKEERPLYIFCDAIDQLTEDDLRNSLKFLPNALPKNIIIVISLLDSFKLPAFYPMQAEKIDSEIQNLYKKEIEEAILGIVRSNGKELPRDIVLMLSRLKNSRNPLYLSMALSRLMMLDAKDFMHIAAGGNDMNAINSYMKKLISSFPTGISDMAVFLLQEAAGRVNFDFCNEVIFLLAISRFGLRESDLQAIFSSRVQEYSSVDLAIFTSYMKNFFMRRDDGRLDFTHRVIREGLLKEIEKNSFTKSWNGTILYHLITLDITDGLRRRELIYHYYKIGEHRWPANAKDSAIDYSLTQYLKEVIDSGDANLIAVTAKELHNIAIIDPDWVEEFAVYAVREIKSSDIFKFFYNDFYLCFNSDTEEYKKACSIFEGILKVSLSSGIDLKSAETQEIISMLYFRLGSINQEIGNYKGALQNYKLKHEIIEKIAEATDDIEAKSEYIHSHMNLGDVIASLGDHDLALSHYKKGLEISEAITDGIKTLWLYRNHAFMTDRVASGYNNLDEYEKALEYRLLANDIYAQIAQSGEFDNMDLQDLVSDVIYSNNNCGLAYMNLGNFDDAKEFFDASVNASETLIEADANVKNYKTLATSYSCMANLYSMVGDDFDLAEEFYQKSVTIFERIVQEENTPENLRALAMAADDADCSDEAINIYRRLANSLKTPSSYSDLARAYAIKAENLDDDYFKIYWHYYSLKYYTDAAQQLKTPSARSDVAFANISLGKAIIEPAAHLEVGDNDDEFDSNGKYSKTRERIKKLLKIEGELDFKKTAMEYFTAGLEVYDSLVSEIDVPWVLQRAAESYKIIGSDMDFYLSDDDNGYEENLYYLKKSAFYAEKLYNQVESPAANDKLSDILELIGNEYWHMGDEENSQLYYNRAVLIREKLARSTISYSAFHKLYDTYENIFDYLAFDDKGELVDCLHKRLCIFDEIADAAKGSEKQERKNKAVEEFYNFYYKSKKLNTNFTISTYNALGRVSDYRKFLSVLFSTGYAARKIGNKKEELEWYEKAFVEVKKIKDESLTKDLYYILAIINDYVAEAYEKLSNDALAIEHRNSAKELRKRASEAK